MPFTINTKSSLQHQCLTKTKTVRKANASKVAVKSAAANAPLNDLAPDIVVVWHDVLDLKPPKRRVRKQSAEHVAETITAIKTFGFISPVTIRKMTVIDGHVRLLAANELGMPKVPCIDVGHLSEEKARLLAISLNRLAEKGEWDLPELKLELEELEIDGFDLVPTFFSEQELEIILMDEPETDKATDGDVVDWAEPPAEPVSLEGDLWLMGKGHRLLCGNSLEAETYELLMDGKTAAAVLTDAPYNVKIAGNVSGLGATKHGEFKMASGEMSQAQFEDFLRVVHKHCADHISTGAVVYSFMDWRSIDLLMAAARHAGLTHINTAVWYKGSGGMGSFLRSAHELCGVFCKGDKPKVNNVELGKHGRDRTNVWVYPGANKPGTSSGKALKDHPTPKNADMCADALLDVTVRGDIVLDPFLGSGTTLIAAEKTRRLCYGVELDPGYVDVCVRKWEELTGKQAILAATGQTFAEVAEERGGE